MSAIASLIFIFRLSQFFGLFPFSIKQCKGSCFFKDSKKSLTPTITATIFFAFAGTYLAVVEVYVSLHQFYLRPSGTVLILTNLCLVLSGAVMFWSILTKRNKFRYWLNKIPDVFSRLKKASLRKVATIYRWIFAVTVTFLLLSLYVEYFLYSLIEKEQPLLFQDLLFAFSYYVVIFECHFRMLETQMFIQLFYMFVNLIRFYYLDTRELLHSSRKTRDKQFWLKFLREFRAEDLELKDLLDFLHSFFVPVVSLNLLYGFFMFLFAVSMAMMKLDTHAIAQLVWSIFIFWDVLLVAALCQMAENEGERTLHCFHEQFIQWDDKELRKEIDIISLQLLHRRLEFVALGSHRLNFSLMYWMIGLLSSYAIIMAQFQIGSKMGGGSQFKENVTYS